MEGNQVKIAFIGSHSTGKTTVARPIADHLGVPFLSEVARMVAQDWGLTPATVPPERVAEYQWTILRGQVDGEKPHPAYVSDRSTVDNAAYFLAYAAHRTHPADVFLYLNAALVNTRHYDLLVLIPPMFAPVDDGERHTDPVEQARIHEVVCNLLDAWGLTEKVYTVTSVTPEGRVEEILGVIYARKED